MTDAFSFFFSVFFSAGVYFSSALIWLSYACAIQDGGREGDRKGQTTKKSSLCT